MPSFITATAVSFITTPKSPSCEIFHLKTEPNYSLSIVYKLDSHKIPHEWRQENMSCQTVWDVCSLMYPHGKNKGVN